MKRSIYREYDYAFGQTMLSLRSTIGLTQAGLAEALGISHRSIASWEAGDKFPKVEHLKHLIALAVAHQAFHAGQEADEIRALWQAAHQKVLLDEIWLAELLSSPQATPIKAPVESSRHGVEYTNAPFERRRRVDWDNAVAVPIFFGRERELSLLAEWVIEEGCQLIAVLGMGGIGKSALAIHLMRQVEAEFDVVIWRSLRDSPTCAALIDDCLQVLAPALPAQMPVGLEQRLVHLLEYLRDQRVLIVLDNLETLLEEGVDSGRMRPGYEDYERFLQRVGESTHQSCLLLTSREKPTYLTSLESNSSLVRILRLARLESKPCELLLAEKGVTGSSADKARLIDAYGGNPLALKIVTQTIVDLFDGEIAWFLAQGEIIFGTIRTLLAEQFARLSPIEQSVLLWLAILREPATLDEILALFVRPVARTRLLEAIEAIHRRSLIERGKRAGTFTLHSVVLEYATTWLITQASGEIEQGKLARLLDYSLCQAQAKEYIWMAQEQFLVIPLLTRLQSTGVEAGDLEARLLYLLDDLRALPQVAQGYGPANLIALLRLLRGNLRGLDLSHLALHGISLHGVEMQDSSLAGATVHTALFTEPMGIIHSVATTQSYWAVCNMIGTISVRRDEGRTLHLSIAAHDRQVNALAFGPPSQTPQLLATGSFDCTVKLWDPTNGQLLHTLNGHTNYVQSVDFSADGRLLASGSDDQSIRIWEVASGLCLRTIHAHSDNVYGVSWSPDGRRLASCGFDGLLRIWEIETGVCVQTFVDFFSSKLARKKGEDDQPNQLTQIKFSPDGKLLASSGFDNAVRIWELASGVCVQSFDGHVSAVRTIAWSPDGEAVASAGYDGTIRLWQLPYPTAVRVFYGHAAAVNAIAFTADGALLLSGSDDHTARVWEIATGRPVCTAQGYGLFFFGVVWSADGRRLLSANSDATLTVWDTRVGKVLQTLRGHSHTVYAAGWSPDGQWLSSGGYDQTIRIWDANSGVCVRVIEGHSDIVYHTVWSADGRWLASASRDRTVRLWDPATGQCQWIGRGHTSPINEVKWSPDGEWLASCGEDRVIHLWRAQDGTLLQTLAGHATSIAGIAWSPDGRFLASCGGGGTEGELLLWDIESGEPIQAFRGQSGVVFRVAWSLDGTILLSGGITGIIYWWDVASGECLRTRPGHYGWIRSLQVSPDGSTLVSSGEDTLIHLWDIQSAERIRTLHIDRPYERMDITGLSGITEAQRTSLIALGAIMQNRMDVPQPETGRGKTANLSAFPAVAESQLDSRDSYSAANLPFQSTSFIGRAAEIAEIVRILSDPAYRLLTLVGPGGIGKTRLAVRAAINCADHFDDGVYFIPLQPLDSPEFIISTIIDVFSSQFRPRGDPKQELFQYLREKALLLVMDNFEHLIGGAEVLTEILEAAPELKLLVTSREVLNLQEEWRYPVRGLHYPETDDAEQPGAYSAVQLFVERARHVSGDFSLAAEQAGVIRICQLVEGMPLALELAAGWTKTLPTSEVATEIQRSLDFLSTSLRNVPQRHQSMQAVFEQTWQRLSHEEQRVFSALSVFSGGFRREAAEAVAGVSMRVLSDLVDKSLLTREPTGRYHIHELLRQYAQTRLETRPDEMLRVHDLHAAYYTGFLYVLEQDLNSRRQRDASLEIEAELDNIRAAWSWVVEHARIEAVEQAQHPLFLFYLFQSRSREGTGAFEKAAQMLDIEILDGGDPRKEILLARVLCSLGWIFVGRGALELAQAVLERSYMLQSRHAVLPSPGLGSDPRLMLAFVYIVLGSNINEAEQLSQDALQDHTLREDRFNLASAYDVLAVVARVRGQYEDARVYAQQAYACTVATGDEYMGSLVLREWAMDSQLMGDTADAKRRHQACYAIHQDFRDRKGMADTLISLGRIALLEGDNAEARRCFEQARTLYHKLGDHVGLASALEGMGNNALALGHYGEARRYLREALQVIHDRMLPLTLSVFIGIGELFLQTGKHAYGVELLVFVLHHPVGYQDTKERAQRLLNRYPAAADAAQRASTQGDFEAVTRVLLDEL